MRGVQLVWNKGIAALCDRRFPDEFAGGRYDVDMRLAGGNAHDPEPAHLIADVAVCDDMPEGALVWVRLAWLRAFVREILPRICTHFVLVTGDSDSSAPRDCGTTADKLLRNRWLRHWYAQNHDGTRPAERISGVPIGIDFHSVSERPSWGEPVTSPTAQETLLRSLRAELPEAARRRCDAYVDFGWQQRSERNAVLRALYANPVVFRQAGPLRRSLMWRARGEHAFVVSPHGNGLDCHRTWEALALGHIVIVRRSPLDELYEGLRVVVVDDWREINRSNLERWQADFSGGGEASLTSRYWVERMKRGG